MTNVPRLKIVVVGDGACGKTCLLISFARDVFEERYVPTVFENHVSEITVEGKSVMLALWDTAGQEDYDRLRPLSYPDSEAILICISADSPDSLSNVKDKWLPEVRHFCPKIPYMVVCCKSDLFDDEEYKKSEGAQILNREYAQEQAFKMGAADYVECSAKTRENVTLVFQKAVMVARLRKSKKFSMQRVCFFL